ncbi:MAG: hypothetical protein HC838_08900 [Spirulinaceae cyanobacterium RM2_2_10]|nr:hypothetical protein [Spirulinaceae cyanobacterium SM2_1_0]NJO20141.1 hypothetical protein [Spirulinaceae cyanobacterium RM2_2_10]
MSHPQAASKRPYRAPQLTVYGNITYLTQAVADLGDPDNAGMGTTPNRTL